MEAPVSSASGLETTMEVVVSRSAARMRTGSSATVTASEARRSVETKKRRLRTRSRNSRRATSQELATRPRACGRSCSVTRRSLTRRPRRPMWPGGPRRSIASPPDGVPALASVPGSISAGWPTCSMKTCSSEGSATSKWVTRAPAASAAASTASGSTSGSISISARSMPGRSSRAPRTPASHASAWSPRVDSSTIRRPVERFTSASDPRRSSGRDRRSRLTRTSPRPSPSDGWRGRSSCHDRGARGSPRAAARC